MPPNEMAAVRLFLTRLLNQSHKYRSIFARVKLLQLDLFNKGVKWKILIYGLLLDWPVL